MPAHGLSGFVRQVGANRLRYRLMLFLDPAQIFAKAVRVTFKRANALPRNDQASEELEKPNEAIILRRQGDCLMESEVLLDRTFATGNGAAEDPLRLPDGFDLNVGGALAGNGGRFGFDGHAQLQNIENAVEGSETVGVDNIGLPAGIAIDERPGTLPRDNEPAGPQGRNRLTHNGPAYAHAPHHFLFRGKFRAGGQFAGNDLFSQAIDNLCAEASRRPDWPEQLAALTPRRVHRGIA